MTKKETLQTLTNPVPSAVLKKWPEGQITQYWADNPTRYSEVFNLVDDFSKYVEGHTGLDIVGAFRTSIVSASSGKVYYIKTDRNNLGGVTAYIETVCDDGVLTFAYGHLDEAIVHDGEYVTRGQSIGYMGNTGFVVSGNTPYWGNAPAGVGVHCHFGIYETVKKSDGTFVKIYPYLQGSIDPLPWLTGNWGGTSILLTSIAKWLGSVSSYLLQRSKKLS